MPSPYGVIVVGSGPAGATAARYGARRGLKVLLVDKRKEIGVPVQCGEYVAHNEEVHAIFPTVTELEDLMEVPYRVREIDTPVIRIWSPNGRRYDIPFKGFTVRRDRMDQGIAAQAVAEGAELMTETTVLRVHGEDVETNHGTFHGKVIIGSDGPRSTVAKSVGLEWPVAAPAMSATADGEVSAATDMFFGNLAPGGYAWSIPEARSAMADGRRRALGRRRAHQALRGPILRVRPVAGCRDGPPGPTSDGARDPMPTTLPSRQREGLIAPRSIDGGSDGLPVSRRRLGGRPPRYDPEEGTDFPPVRLRTAASRPAAVPDARASRGRDVHQPCPSRPHGDDPVGHPTPGCGRRPDASDRGCRGSSLGGFPEDRGRRGLRRAVR